MSLTQDEQTELMTNFERSHRLYQTTHSTGWADVLDVLENEVVKAEFRLLNLKTGESELMIRDVRTYAQVARSLFEQVQIQIKDRIEMGLNPELISDSEVASYNNF